MPVGRRPVGRRPAAAILLAGMVVGCSAAGTMTHRAGAPAGAVGTPRRGGVLRVGLTSPSSLDPALARTPDELLLAGQLFASLTAYDPASGEPVPALAASWQASADERSWEFTLAAGRRFSDGGPLTAADVASSLERVARLGSASPGASLLAGVHGIARYATGGATRLDGVTTPAPDVVRIVLDRPLAVLPSLLGSPNLGIGISIRPGQNCSAQRVKRVWVGWVEG